MVSMANDELGNLYTQLLHYFLVESVTIATASPSSSGQDEGLAAIPNKPEFLETLKLAPDQPPAVLFQVWLGLQQVIGRTMRQDWPYYHNPTSILLQAEIAKPKISSAPYSRYCLYVTACKGLLSWPYGFYAFIQAYTLTEYRARLSPSHKTSILHAELGEFYTVWIARHWQRPIVSIQKSVGDQC
jgi:hypothetical protein